MDYIVEVNYERRFSNCFANLVCTQSPTNENPNIFTSKDGYKRCTKLIVANTWDEVEKKVGEAINGAKKLIFDRQAENRTPKQKTYIL